MSRNIAIWLVVINIIIFIFQIIDPQITDQFALVSADILSRPWILVTSMFLHGGIEHIIFNMFALGLFGFILERIVGSKKFLLLYFASGIVAGIASSFFYEASIGASGAIFGVLGTLGVLRPRMVIYLGYIPMPMAAAVVLWMIINVFGLIVPGQTAYAAHIGGLIFGLIYGFYLKKDFGEHYEKRKKHRMNDKEIDNWERRYMVKFYNWTKIKFICP